MIVHFCQENILWFDYVSVTSFQKAEMISTSVSETVKPLYLDNH